MPAVDIPQLEPGKETTDDWKYIVRHIMTTGSTNEQCGSIEMGCFGIFEREVSQLIECSCEIVDGYPES